MTRININATCWVTLTDLGMEVIRHTGVVVHPGNQCAMPLWEAMLLFGPHMQIGNRLPIETTVEIED